MIVREFLSTLPDGPALTMMLSDSDLSRTITRIEPLKVVDIDMTPAGGLNENTDGTEQKFTIPQGTLFFAREISISGGRAGDSGSNGPAGFVRYPDGAFPSGMLVDTNVAAANMTIDALEIKLKIGSFDVNMKPGGFMAAPGVVGRAESMRPIIPLVLTEKEEIVATIRNDVDTIGSITARLQLTGFALIV